MAGPKVLGIDQITPRIILESIITLLLFSFATSGLFELWKLLPTVFSGNFLSPDWWSLFLYLFPLLVFMTWFFIIYRKYKYVLKPLTKVDSDFDVTAHKGIIVVLSAPKDENPESIIAMVQHCRTEGNIEDLFELWSIGQIFKGLYHHEEALRYVWLILTDQSKAYEKCIEEFLKSFLPEAKIVRFINAPDSFVLRGESDLDFIENTKLFFKPSLFN